MSFKCLIVQHVHASKTKHTGTFCIVELKWTYLINNLKKEMFKYCWSDGLHEQTHDFISRQDSELVSFKWYISLNPKFWHACNFIIGFKYNNEAVYQFCKKENKHSMFQAKQIVKSLILPYKSIFRSGLSYFYWTTQLCVKT